MSDQTATPATGLWLKLVQIAGSLSSIRKDGTNTHFNYKFAKSEDVLDLIRPALANAKIAFFATMTGVDVRTTESKGNLSYITRCSFTYTFMDAETGEMLKCDWFGEAQDNQDKGINKAATAALKYFLLKTFMISIDDEDDPDADGKKGQSNKQSSPSQRQSPAIEAKRAELLKALAELHGKEWQVEEERYAKLVSNGKSIKLLQLSETQIESLINKVNGELRALKASKPAEPVGK